MIRKPEFASYHSTASLINGRRSWALLSPAQFRRLCFVLCSSTNPNWTGINWLIVVFDSNNNTIIILHAVGKKNNNTKPFVEDRWP